MKKGLLILIVAIVTGLAAFAFMRSQKRMESDRPAASLLETMPELAWLRKDLKLTDQQFGKISELHAAYRPKCEEMCDQIYRAHLRMDEAAQGATSVTPALEAAIADHVRIHAECQRAMLDHLYRTAAELDKKQAARYLDTMLPYALDFSHSEPNGGGEH